MSYGQLAVAGELPVARGSLPVSCLLFRAERESARARINT
jgi:hypothetical protein